jgi:hypothetical protein
MCVMAASLGVSAVQGSEELVGKLVRKLQFSRCELLLVESGS